MLCMCQLCFGFGLGRSSTLPSPYLKICKEGSCQNPQSASQALVMIHRNPLPVANTCAGLICKYRAIPDVVVLHPASLPLRDVSAADAGSTKKNRETIIASMMPSKYEIHMSVGCYLRELRGLTRVLIITGPSFSGTRHRHKMRYRSVY